MNDDLAAVLIYRHKVKVSLEALLKTRAAGAKQLAWKRDLIRRLLVFAGGGKLLRGCLVCFSYALPNADDPPETVLRLAAAIELMHSALLIHDDIIDQDDQRRGRPSLHDQYRQLAVERSLAEPERFGQNMALCAGDIALATALSAINNLALAPTLRAGLMELFDQALTDVFDGQMQDIHLGMSTVPPSKKAIYKIMRAKTAGYSVALPLAAGGLIAGQTAANCRQLYEIGMAAGVIFQIRDDELGVFGVSQRLGKPIGSDIREDKKTLLYYYLQRAAAPEDWLRWKRIFGNRHATPADVETVRRGMEKHKVPARLNRDVKRLESQANQLIAELTYAPEAKAKLRQLVKFCAERTA